MRKYKKGDPCPCCGQPIKTNDPDVLRLLDWIGAQRRFPTLPELEALTGCAYVSRERGGSHG